MSDSMVGMGEVNKPQSHHNYAGIISMIPMIAEYYMYNSFAADWPCVFV